MARQKEDLAGPDAFWLRAEQPTNLMMIVGILTFDEPLDLETLKALFEERFLVYDRFRQRVMDRNGSPYWEEDPYFDLSRHLHRVALPDPGGQDELEAMVSDLMNTPLDFKKPLWQMHLVENYGTGCALIGRIHHCIADGIALIQVLLSLADEYAGTRASSNRSPTKRKESDKGLLPDLLKPVADLVTGTAKVTGAVLGEGLELVTSPSHLFNRAKQGLSIGAALSKLALMNADSDTVFRGKLSATKRAAWSQPVPLKDVKAIAKGADVKINDVLLTAVCGALRRYLEGQGEPVDAVNLRAIVPVNLRPPQQPVSLGNRFGLVFLSLPLGIEDPEMRLAEVKRRMDQVKFSSEAPVVLGLMQLVSAAPKEVQDQVVGLLSTRASAVMTNVPGPRERLHMAGSTLRHIMFWVPRSGEISLGVSILSYAGEVLLGIATDRRLVPNPSAIVDGFHEEFASLKKQFT
jgi:diacylglycerol O-acyltransferase